MENKKTRRLNYKNSQAMELAFDGRLAIYKSSLHEMKGKKVPGDVEGHIKVDPYIDSLYKFPEEVFKVLNP